MVVISLKRNEVFDLTTAIRVFMEVTEEQGFDSKAWWINFEEILNKLKKSLSGYNDKKVVSGTIDYIKKKILALIPAGDDE